MSYEELKNFIRNLMKDNKLKNKIENRVKEFENARKLSWKEFFAELCFCILTANSSAELGIKIIDSIGPEGLLNLSENELAEALSKLGHRYPRARAKYIVEARKYAKDLKKIVLSLPEEDAREWLVKNIKGIGWKEASHFLRNIGAKNLAIIDRHILRVLKDYGIIKEAPKTLTKKKYLEIERILREMAKDLGITVSELDLYLWYSRTGKVLK